MVIICRQGCDNTLLNIEPQCPLCTWDVTLHEPGNTVLDSCQTFSETFNQRKVSNKPG